MLNIKTPFNNLKYKQLQKEDILKRINSFDKLYIEVGGKLYDDTHAARVLPGFNPNVKIEIFEELKNQLEIIFCINANHIINNKTRKEYNKTYMYQLLESISIIKSKNISIAGVVITFYKNNPKIDNLESKLKEQNIKIYKSYFIDNYPNDINKILSKDGFGLNDYIKTNSKIILVSAPGAGSGKLEVCLNQLYHDKLNNIISSYAKYETFPVWNLPIDHPINKAYESATQDLKDYNIIDPYYFKKYNKKATSYNRDIDAFPILKNILYKIHGYDIYDSPTEMGINNIGFAIEDDDKIREASLKEIKLRQ